MVVSGFVVPLPPESPLLVSVFVEPLLGAVALGRALAARGLLGWTRTRSTEELSPESLSRTSSRTSLTEEPRSPTRPSDPIRPAATTSNRVRRTRRPPARSNTAAAASCSVRAARRGRRLTTGSSPAARWTAFGLGAAGLEHGDVVGEELHPGLRVDAPGDRSGPRGAGRTSPRPRSGGRRCRRPATPSSRWTWATAVPVSPRRRSCGGRLGSALVPGRRSRWSPPPELGLAAAKRGAIGDASRAALTASEMPLRRGRGAAVDVGHPATLARATQRALPQLGGGEITAVNGLFNGRTGTQSGHGVDSFAFRAPAELADGLARKARATSQMHDDSPQRLGSPAPRASEDTGIRLGHVGGRR